jgi:hypothetical protein
MKPLSKNCLLVLTLLWHALPQAQAQGGLPLWTNRYNGPGNGSDIATALAVDASGNALVTGYSSGTSGTNYDYATVAYSAAGAPLWTNRYNGPANNHAQATAIAVDASGKVFVTGFSWSGTVYEFATLAYSSSGVPLWTNRAAPGAGKR